MMTKMRLGNVATLRYGVTMRSSVKPLTAEELQSEESPLGLVQMKDLTEYNRLDLEEIYYIRGENPNPEHLLKPGDILFRSRGITNTAVYLDTVPENVIASSPLIVIRLKSLKADPAYIAWFINHTEGQRQIHRFSMGTSLLSVNVSDLRDIEVPLPPLETQRQIIEIATLGQQERELMDRLTEKRSQYLRAVLGNCIKN